LSFLAVVDLLVARVLYELGRRNIPLPVGTQVATVSRTQVLGDGSTWPAAARATAEIADGRFDAGGAFTVVGGACRPTGAPAHTGNVVPD
jgi:hypothetical protein